MTGAIIADLAAWTWENEREVFDKKLISDNAVLSEYGLTMLLCGDYILNEKPMEWRGIEADIIPHFRNADERCVQHRDVWARWLASGDRVIPFEVKQTLVTAGIIASEWAENPQETAQQWETPLHCGKQEYYATYLSEVLSRLRRGATKDEAGKEIPCILDYYKSGSGHKWEDYLTYLTFAWRCFYYSYDYTSAVRNAMKCDGDRHLAAVLTGALADAMYGSALGFSKKKDNEEFCYNLRPRDSLAEAYGDIFCRIQDYEWEDRTFFPKNNAMTNVELHQWQNVENPFADKAVSEESRRRILKGLYTGWDNRYGFYLDNGWVYVYRSYCLICRFRLTKQGDDSWRITHLQTSGEMDGDIVNIAMCEALSAVESGWYFFSQEKQP